MRSCETAGHWLGTEEGMNLDGGWELREGATDVSGADARQAGVDGIKKGDVRGIDSFTSPTWRLFCAYLTDVPPRFELGEGVGRRK